MRVYLKTINLFLFAKTLVVTILKKDGSGEASFITGWMVLPNGKLKLNTPYGGK